MTITIEKGVPLPPPRGGANGYPFPDMVVGDSFVVPLEGRTPAALRSKVSAYADAHAKRQPRPDEWKFVTAFERAKEDKSVIVGIRCWRAPTHSRTFPEAQPSAALADALNTESARADVRRMTPKIEPQPLPKKQSGGKRKGAGRPRKADSAAAEIPQFVKPPKRRHRVGTIAEIRALAAEQRPEFSHPIPSFTEGGKPRQVKGTRY